MSIRRRAWESLELDSTAEWTSKRVKTFLNCFSVELPLSRSRQQIPLAFFTRYFGWTEAQCNYARALTQGAIQRLQIKPWDSYQIRAEQARRRIQDWLLQSHGGHASPFDSHDDPEPEWYNADLTFGHEIPPVYRCILQGFVSRMLYDMPEAAFTKPASDSAMEPHDIYEIPDEPDGDYIPDRINRSKLSGTHDSRKRACSSPDSTASSPIATPRMRKLARRAGNTSPRTETAQIPGREDALSHLSLVHSEQPCGRSDNQLAATVTSRAPRHQEATALVSQREDSCNLLQRLEAVERSCERLQETVMLGMASLGQRISALEREEISTRSRLAGLERKTDDNRGQLQNAATATRVKTERVVDAFAHHISRWRDELEQRSQNGV